MARARVGSGEPINFLFRWHEPQLVPEPDTQTKAKTNSRTRIEDKGRARGHVVLHM